MPPPKRRWKNANTPHSVIKDKGKLIKIDWKEREQEVKRIWEGKPPAKLIEKWKEAGLGSINQDKLYFAGNPLARMSKIRRLIGYDGSNLVGYCSMCRNLDTYLFKQKIQGATIVTRYCNEHVPDMTAKNKHK